MILFTSVRLKKITSEIESKGYQNRYVMRTIKFRGRDIKTGKWFFGNYYDRDTKGNTHIANLDEGCLTIDPETVGQFTGLKDKKGQDIYEGDIICVKFIDGSGGNNLIGWNEEFASFGCMNRYEYRSIKEGYDFAAFNGYVLDAYRRKSIIFEVVGNIHDNPELLEK